MADIIRIQVHNSLKDVLERIRGDVANDMKSKFGLSEITVPRTLSSQILAAKHRGKKHLNIKVRKTGPNSGILELL